MTKKLEEMLNVGPADKENENTEETAEEETVEETVDDQYMQTIDEYNKIAKSLPAVKGLGDAADREFDEVATKSMDAYEDLMNLGMNVEARYSARLFEVASAMLKTNLDAKSAKIDKKLKMIEMQLKKEKQDSSNKPKGEFDDLTNGEGYVVTDRNSLLERLKGMDKDK